MSESLMRLKIIKILSCFDAIPVENPMRPGTPDVNYCEGWIELKFVKSWPKTGTILKINHFTPQQKTWLKKRIRKGGKAFLLLRVNKDWLLFDGVTAADKIGKLTKEELISVAISHWSGKINSGELKKCLMK